MFILSVSINLKTVLSQRNTKSTFADSFIFSNEIYVVLKVLPRLSRILLRMTEDSFSKCECGESGLVGRNAQWVKATKSESEGSMFKSY